MPKVEFLAEILHNEFTDRDTRPLLDVFQERLALFADLGEIKVEKETISVKNKNLVRQESSNGDFSSPKDFSFI